ncbi:MAG: DUF5684 domain-containing protein [Eubacteriales bacterium]|nr:DUF5684 domain-containing protein [Eubacteriales bacterium]
MDYSSYDPALTAGVGAALAIYYVVVLAIAIVCLIAEWKMFAKAGEPGWAAIVPFYNTYVLFKISMGNGWLFLLMFVPIVNFVVSIMALFKLASAFGKGVGFGFGLLFLSPIFMCILGFGDAEYVGA